MSEARKEGGEDEPVEHARVDLLAPVCDDADDDLCEKRVSDYGEEEGEEVGTLPAVLAPSLGLVARAEVRDVLCGHRISRHWLSKAGTHRRTHHSVHSPAEEHLVLVVERNDDEQLRLPIVECRTKRKAVLVKFLGLQE